MTVVVKKIGGSMAVVIPQALAREMRLTVGTPLEITARDEAIVMRKPGRRSRRPLKQIVEQMDSASYRRRRKELAEGGPISREIW